MTKTEPPRVPRRRAGAGRPRQQRRVPLPDRRPLPLRPGAPRAPRAATRSPSSARRRTSGARATSRPRTRCAPGCASGAEARLPGRFDPRQGRRAAPGERVRGHVRHRGDERAGSWEYIVDVGLHAAQRCPACNKRFWVERRPAKACPKCGGELTRDRGAPPRDQGRLRHAEGVRGGDEQAARQGRGAGLHAADQGVGAGVPDQGVAAGRQGDDPPHHLPLLRAARDVPHRAAHRLREAGEAHRAAR